MVEVSLQVAILLFAAVFGYVIARKFGQSAVIGEILIGVAIGPSLLGFVSYNESVKLLAELGAIFLLFTVGLECNFKHIYTWKNSIIAFFGVIIPFVVGAWISPYFGYSGIESLFIGVALTATSIAITAHVLAERGVLSTSFAKTILGAAVIDDILSLIFLSAVSGFNQGMNWSSVGWKAIIAIGFIVCAILLIRPVNKLILSIDKHMQGRDAHRVTLFVTMIFAFGYAGIAELIGLSGVIGAFIAGVSMEPLQVPHLREGAAYFEMLFSAIFFVSLGVLFDVNSMSGAWVFAVFITVIAIITKLVGCYIPARLTGHNAHESLLIGFGMIPRGEVAMIVGLIGLTSGIISTHVYSVIIFMAFATTIIAPTALSYILPKHTG